MPTALRVIADWNPVSAVTAAARHLFGNPNPSAAIHAWPLQHPVAASLLWSVELLVIFAPLATPLPPPHHRLKIKTFHNERGWRTTPLIGTVPDCRARGRPEVRPPAGRRSPAVDHRPTITGRRSGVLERSLHDVPVRGDDARGRVNGILARLALCTVERRGEVSVIFDVRAGQGIVRVDRGGVDHVLPHPDLGHFIGARDRGPEVDVVVAVSL
jgi:hypothetical protein